MYLPVCLLVSCIVLDAANDRSDTILKRQNNYQVIGTILIFDTGTSKRPSGVSEKKARGGIPS